MKLLMREIHAPCIYEELPAEELARASHCSLVEQVLRDALKNCVILRDSQGFLRKQANESLRRWPQAHRKYVQGLLMELQKRHRLVPVPLRVEAASSPPQNDCRLAFILADQTDPDAVIFSGSCSICVQQSQRGVCLQAYTMSPFCSNRDDSERIELSAGEWSRQRFESEVWGPLFRYSKRVHIVDRHIGRSAASWGTRTSLDPEFEDSITWIVRQFVESTTHGERHVEISCGVRPVRMTVQQQRGIVAELKKFGRRLEQAFGCSVKVNVKLESRQSQSMPHARFVFADQMYLQIDPGVDLLTTSGGVKEVIISLHRDRGKIEREVYGLPNA